MLTTYEREIYAKDYQKMRMQEREAEIKRFLSQPNTRHSSRMKFRLTKFILNWTQAKTEAKQLQECPEIA